MEHKNQFDWDIPGAPELSTKSFFKRTRKGKVVCLVKEYYLRTDIECGYLFGSHVTTQHLKTLIEKVPTNQVLVVDTNIALHQIDVLEYASPVTSLVVVLQTVLQELKHLNLSIYRRVLNLLKDENKSFIFLPNELIISTATAQEKDESINDCNDRAIRLAALHLYQLLNIDTESSPTKNVLLLTNDVDNQRKSAKTGLLCMGMRSYVNQFKDSYPELLDVAAADAAAAPTGRSGPLYPPHLSMSDISVGLRSGTVLKGTIRCKGGGGSACWTSCYVTVHTSEGQPRRVVDINGGWRVNRAVDGDVVAVQLIDQALLPGEQEFTSALEEGDEDALAAVTIGEALIEPTPEAEEGLPDTPIHSGVANSHAGKSAPVPFRLSGRVVGIIKRNWRQYAGSLLDNEVANDTDILNDDDDGTGGPGSSSSLENGCSYTFVPVDRKIPRVRIATRRHDALAGCRLLVAMDSWPATSLYPLGHYVRVLGKDGDKAVETQVLLHEFDVTHEAFTAEVMACLPPSDWKITSDVIAARTDLRHIPVVSIDPPGCKDIDDALHCIRLPNGRLEAGVHIADVSHFVHPDTAIDKEASHRSTSTYLVERRLDMLPGLLTTELCSLRSKEDHLAFSVLWEFDDEGNIYDVRFCKSVIHSVASLTYDEAQAMLDDPGRVDNVSESVRLLNKLARILRQGRINAGALTLASSEVRFKLDTETQNPTDVTMYALKEANALVEEWMLLANITVSKKVLRHYPTLGVLRRHQPPSREQFAPLLSAATAVGVHLDISSSKTLADSLDAAVRANDPFFNKLLRIMSTRCMMPAQYFCSGEIPKDQWHHYGLAAPVYTHFTSPIRRYADIIVHRLLSAAIGVIALPAINADRSKQQDLCSHLNRRHKAAQHAQRASVNLHTLLFFKNRPSVEAAYVLSVTDSHVGVLVERFGIEGSIEMKPIADALNMVTRLDASTHTVYLEDPAAPGKTKSKSAPLTFQVFQRVNVSIRVKERGTGNRSLIISLVIASRDFGDDDEGQQQKKKKKSKR